MGYDWMQIGTWIIGCAFLLGLLASFIVGWVKKGPEPAKISVTVLGVIGLALILSPQIQSMEAKFAGIELRLFHDQARAKFNILAKVIEDVYKKLPPEKQREIAAVRQEVERVERIGKEPPKTWDEMLDRFMLYSGTSVSATTDLMRLDIFRTPLNSKDVESK
jgi:hypothetical protein